MQERIEIGEILRKGRVRAGLSQEQVAQALYIDRAIISRIETGVIPAPSYMIVKQWARVCKCEDLINIDLTGGTKDAMLELIHLKDRLKKISELVSMMRVKTGRRKTRAANR